MKLTLTRFAATADGTLGRLGRFCVLEEEDQSNRRNVSAIPVGVYRCVRHVSPTFGETFWVKDVPGRSEIMFHRGNTEEDTAGCLLVGHTFGALTVRDENTGDYAPKLAVLRSGVAFDAFMVMMDGVDECELEVKEYGT